eukprot:1807729-Rhodomonas_salina.1
MLQYKVVSGTDVQLYQLGDWKGGGLRWRAEESGKHLHFYTVSDGRSAGGKDGQGTKDEDSQRLGLVEVGVPEFGFPPERPQRQQIKVLPAQKIEFCP